MGSSQHAFVNVAGVAARRGATLVNVWCRNEGPEGDALLASTHVVRSAMRPPGIQVGQFSVTFRLPPESSVEDLFVTDDADTSEHLTRVTITPCETAYSLAKIRAGVASLQDAAVTRGS